MEDSKELSSRNFHSKGTSRHLGKNASKEEEKNKFVHPKELSESLIEEVANRIGRARMHIPTNRAIEAMTGISKSPFASWIMQELKPKKLCPQVLDKFNGKADPITHLL